MSSSDPKPGPKPGPLLPAPESSPVPPSTWAKRTGFRPKFSGETTASHSGQLPSPASARASQPETLPDLEAGQPPLRPPPPVSAGEPDKKDKNDKPPPPQPQPPSAAAAPVKRRRDSDGGRTNGPVGGGGGGANGSGDPVRRQNRVEERVEVLPQSMDDDDLAARNLHMNYGLRDTPGLGQCHK